MSKIFAILIFIATDEFFFLEELPIYILNSNVGKCLFPYVLDNLCINKCLNYFLIMLGKGRMVSHHNFYLHLPSKKFEHNYTCVRAIIFSLNNPLIFLLDCWSFFKCLWEFFYISGILVLVFYNINCRSFPHFALENSDFGPCRFCYVRIFMVKFSLFILFLSLLVFFFF